MLVVEFVVGAGHNALTLGEAIESWEELVEGSLHKSGVVAHHGVGLAWAGLAVDEDAAVVALKSVDQKFFPDCIVDIFLIGGGREDAIEGEGVFFHFDLAGGIDDSFLLAAGFDSDQNLDGILGGALLSIHILTVIFWVYA